MTSKLDRILENIKNIPEAEIVFRNDHMSGYEDRVFLYIAPRQGIYSITKLNKFQDKIIGSMNPHIKIKFYEDYLKYFFSPVGYFEGLKKGLKPGHVSFEENLDVEVIEKVQTDYELKSNDSHLNTKRLSKIYSGKIKDEKVYFTKEKTNNYSKSNKPFFTRYICLKFSPNKEIISDSIKKWIKSGRKEEGYNLDLPHAIRFGDLPEKIRK
jgi:hypothetical protein